MEFFQIAFNLIFLGVLAWWICREKKREVSREEFEQTKKTLVFVDTTLLQAVERTEAEIKGMQNRSEEYASELQGLLHNRASGGEIAEAIKTGAAMAQTHMDAGAKLVLTALARDGRVASEDSPKQVEAINLGEEDYEIRHEPVLPDIIVARNQKMAEQIGDRLVADLMRGMDEKI